MGASVLERDQLFNVRLTLTINLIEDQFLLMSLLTHLNFTFKTMYKLKQGEAQASSGSQLSKVGEIITQFDTVFTRCLVNFNGMLKTVRGVSELHHILAALPTIKTFLANTLT